MMQFTKIDINNWTRKEYFDHYFDNTPCTYSMTVKLDISKLKKDGKKLYPTLLYGVTTILNRHEEFRTALDKNGQVGVFSEMLPCYTIFHKETETFSSIWTEFTMSFSMKPLRSITQRKQRREIRSRTTIGTLKRASRSGFSMRSSSRSATRTTAAARRRRENGLRQLSKSLPRHFKNGTRTCGCSIRSFIWTRPRPTSI